MSHEAVEYPAENIIETNFSELRSEMAQEIISQKPGFIEKWAMLIFLAVLLLVLFAAWLIKYPDIVEADAVLTAANAPKEIIIRQEGRIVELFVKNNEAVHENEMLGYIESTAKHEEVLQLSLKIDSSLQLMNDKKQEKVARLFLANYTNLGELQQDYQNFITSLQSFNDDVANGFYEKKRVMLSNDIQSLHNTNKTIQQQKALTQQDVKLAEETYKMNKKLSDDKVLSKDELRQENSKYLSKQMELPQLDAALSANQIQQQDKQKELEQLEHDRQQQPEIFRQALQSLKSRIDDWKKNFVLQSPVTGKISFTIPLQINEFLQRGKIIGYIIPDDNHFYTQAYLPQNNFGKVSKGERVQLRFDAYPYQEFGFVEGAVNYVSNVATDSGFLATIQLSNGLKTNNNTVIPYRNGLKAQAVIITQDMRLLNRLWYNIKKSASVGKKNK